MMKPCIPFMFVLWVLIGLTDRSLGDTLKVDCSQPEQTVTKALQQAKPGDIIRVTGTCKEAITIVTDDVVLEGHDNAVIDAQGATQGALTIDGARRVTIKQVTVQGGSDGVYAKRGATVRLEGVTAQENSDDGIEIGMNSTATITDCMVVRNQDDGVEVDNNATVDITNCTARENGGDGLVVFRTSSATLRGTIRSLNNARDGIFVGMSSSCFFLQSIVTMNQNGRRGISVVLSGSLVASGGSIGSSDNVHEGLYVSTGGSLAVYSPEVQLDGNRDGLTSRLAGSVFIGKKTKLMVRNNKQHGVVMWTDGSGRVQGEVIAAGNPSGDRVTKAPTP